MQDFYADMKNRVRASGRNPDHCVILPSIDVIVAETEEQAHEQSEYVDSFASLEMGVNSLSGLTGTDLSKYPFDTPVADVPVDLQRVVTMGVYRNLVDMRKNGRGLTIREAALLQASTWMCPRLVGTPSMVVDQMLDIFEAEACDGFVIGTSTSPMGLRNFVKLVVPELQRRGLYRAAYTGKTFRENLRS